MVILEILLITFQSFFLCNCSSNVEEKNNPINSTDIPFKKEEQKAMENLNNYLNGIEKSEEKSKEKFEKIDLLSKDFYDKIISKQKNNQQKEIEEKKEVTVI